MEMVTAKPGNLLSVYLGQAEVREIERKANETMLPSLRSELSPDTQGQWLIVVTMPGEENIASGHLIGRGFGVFQPREPKTYLRRGRKVDVMRPMYPNYLFVYVWGIDRHVRRILACTGVSDILRHPDDRSPVIVPWSEIDKIRGIENQKNPMILRMDELNGKAKKRKRFNKKARMKALRNPEVSVSESDLDIVSVRSFGFSKSLGTWDEETEQRVSDLHKALGLAA